MTLEWEGVVYDVPEQEPPQDRNLEGLNPIFRDALEHYVAFAQQFTGYEIRFGECRRNTERQLWLLAQGRANSERVRSWTLSSRHLWGLACDLILIDSEGKAVWSSAVWEALYATAPPEWFGLKHLAPKEYVHLELASADALIARADELGLYQS
jgi:hypothetical protein